jgi:hypothetical protein
MSMVIPAQRVKVRIIDIDYSDFSIAAMSRTINIGDAIPANHQLLPGSVECTTVPAGGGTVSYDIQFGDGVDSSGLCTAEDHLGGGVDVYQAYGAYITTGIGFENAARQLTATATVDGAHLLNDATQGAWVFRYAYIQF